MCVGGGGGGGVGVLDSRHIMHVILTHNKKRERKKKDPWLKKCSSIEVMVLRVKSVKLMGNFPPSRNFLFCHIWHQHRTVGKEN